MYRLSNLNALSLNDAARLLKNARAYLSFALMALSLSSGMTVTENGVPESSERKGSPLRRSNATKWYQLEVPFVEAMHLLALV